MKRTLLFSCFMGLMNISLSKETAISEAGDRTSNPNFIIILTDDQGFNDLGCYGSENIRTPHLDRMAKEGVRFTSFYGQHVCGPSRAALLTGCYPLRVAERNNVKSFHPVLHSKEITIAELLKDVGYTTAAFGKWHLAGHSQEPKPSDQEPEPAGIYPKWYEPDLMPRQQGFDYFFGTPCSNDGYVNLLRNDSVIEKKADMSLLTKRYTDEAIGFIEKNKDRPFFVYLAHTMPHTKLAASEKFRGQSPRGPYGDAVEEIDFNVGKILSKLHDLKIQDKTYVFYMSDNGPWLIKNKDHRQGFSPEDQGGSAKPLRSGKVSTWEGGVRVPAIAWAPGLIPGGNICNDLASNLDLFPTIAAIAGASLHADRVIDGENIFPLLTGMRDKANKDKVFYYYFHTHLQAVRKGKWKMHLPRPDNPEWLGTLRVNRHIHPSDDIGFENPVLFNLETDPSESVDVSTKFPQIVDELLRIAQKGRADIGDYNQIGTQARFFDNGPHRPDIKNLKK